MEAKIKALELAKAFAKKSNNLKQRTDWNYDKECALITVNELIRETGSKYYYDVKSEIEKL